jgi:hypothetical protein
MTNNKNVEKTILFDECLRISLRLYLEGSYDHDEPETAKMVQDAARQCPQLFSTFFNTHQDEESVEAQGDYATHDTSVPTRNYITFDTSKHKNVRVWSKLESSAYAELGIPSRLARLPPDHPFMILLGEAYRSDFDVTAMSYYGPTTPKWFKKLSFDYM